MGFAFSFSRRRVVSLLRRSEDEVRLLSGIRASPRALGLAEPLFTARPSRPRSSAVGLVFHQRDQRRHHDRGAAHLQRGQLVAEATCRRRKGMIASVSRPASTLSITSRCPAATPQAKGAAQD